MEYQKISLLQFLYIIIGFEIGNTMIYGLGGAAKQDSWFVIFLGMIGGIILMFVYTQLAKYYPGDSLFQMIPKIIGKFLSYPIILIYIAYFTYLSARAYRDFGELILATILDDTPMVVVIGSFMILATYCLRGGVESFGKMGEIVFPFYFFSIILIWILLFSVEHFRLSNLSPLLGKGIKPVMTELFPTVLTFPFGESIIITTFFPFIQNKNKIRKTGMAIILISGVILITNVIIILSVLGPEIYHQENYPLLSATRMVSIADFLERFDAIIILMIVSGVFFKVGCWTFGAATGILYLFKINHFLLIVLGLGIIIVTISIVTTPNQVAFVSFGLKFVTLYVHVPLQIIFPIILLCTAFIKKKWIGGSPLEKNGDAI